MKKWGILILNPLVGHKLKNKYCIGISSIAVSGDKEVTFILLSCLLNFWER